MKRGFTLVELSIVLVIIGLLIGGILVAQSMIQTAKTSKLIKDIGLYEVAVNNFKLNYRYYPGDSGYFVPPGNQNNILYDGANTASLFCASAPYATLSNLEYQQAWAHLSQAKMIDNNYISHSPIINCSGTHTSYFTTTYADKMWPYTYYKLTAKVEIKYPIQIVKPYEGGNLGFQMALSAEYVVPMETKLGAQTSNGLFTQTGLVNTRGPGICYNGAIDVSCFAPTALSGSLIYLLAPI